MLDQLVRWDKELFIYLNSLGEEQFDGFWIFVTQISSWIPFFILLLFLVLYFLKLKRGLITAFFTIAVFGVTHGITYLTKRYIGRLRPNNDESISEMIRVLQTPHDFSFFSGHASSSFAVTVFIVLILRPYTKKWICLLFIWPILFVLSRIYVGVHFPSDLLVGAIVGTLISSLSYKLIWKKFPFVKTV